MGKARQATRDALRDLRDKDAGRKAKAGPRDLKDGAADRDEA